ncbi:MAG: DUF3488 and DUF4129 domain-containing transglutaminase family protein [Acidimicrobiia bacterium]
MSPVVAPTPPASSPLALSGENAGSATATSDGQSSRSPNRRSGRAVNAGRSVSDSLMALEIGLTVLTVVTALSYARVFSGWDFARPLAATAVAAHVVAIGCRRLRAGLLVSLAASLVGLALAGTALFYRSTSRFGVPTHDSWVAFSDEMRQAWDAFDVVKAPVPSTGGFVVLAAIGIWVSAYLADTFAIRARASVESVVPTAVMFVICTVLAADRLRITFAIAQVAAALVAIALHRVWAQQTSAGWLTGRRRGGASAMMRAGAATAAVAVVVGAVVAPQLPGAGSEALLDTSGPGNDQRVTVSPLVDIRGRIAGQVRTEAFRVTSSQPSYWRLTTLNQFDGAKWTGDTSFKNIDDGQSLPGGLAADVSTEVTQQFTLSGLVQDYLPVAAEPLRITGVEGLSFAKDTGSVLLDKNLDRPDTYSVVSRVANLTPDELRAVGEPSGSGVSGEFLKLPSDLPASIASSAAQITAGITTEYDKAITLQKWFQSNFDYDLNIRAQPGENPLVSFLQQGAGYCEQFAGTYAVMARTLGMPSRVAVGFTHGIAQPDGSYLVQGRHAHAWPEVYFRGIGWVPFEPTPGRGLPGAAQSYTGLAAAQEGEQPVVNTTPTTAPGATTVPGSPAATTIAPNLFEDPSSGATGSTADKSTSSSPWPGRIVWTAATIVVLAVAWVGGLATFHLLRRRRRRSQAHSDAQRVQVAWTEATESLARVGFRLDPVETPLEYAARVERASDLDVGALWRLANRMTEAAFAPSISAAEAEQAVADAVAVEAEVTSRATRAEKLKHLVSV